MWNDNITQLSSSLQGLDTTSISGVSFCCNQAFSTLKAKTEDLRERHGTIFLIGNGASSSIASHVSADLAKNGGVNTQVFTDMSLITALANDISYDHVFSEPIKARFTPGDMLIGISSSGNSKNILNAVEEAKKCGGDVVTLSAMKPNNPLRSMGDINFYIPAQTYGMAETSHNAVLHYWIDLITGDAHV